MRYLSSIALAISLASCGGGSSAPPPAQFTSLDTLPGFASMQLWSLSADGSLAAGTAQDGTGGLSDRAFSWRAGSFTTLPLLPGGTFNRASAVSADGSVIVGTGNTSSVPATSSAPVRWSGGAASRIDGIAGALACSGDAVSGDGQKIAGTCLTSSGNEAFVWTAATGGVGLGKFGGGLGASSSTAAISKDGSVVVGSGNPVIAGAMLWNVSGSAVVLGKLAGDTSAVANAVSRDGSVVAGTSTNDAQAHRAFRWTALSGMVALQGSFAGHLGSTATGISGDGSTIVGWADTTSGETAFIWEATHGLRTLESALTSEWPTNIAGWKLGRAMTISDDGRVIGGTGTNPEGKARAWIIKLPQ
jgi:probable HAF family extracellular repeat protein